MFSSPTPAPGSRALATNALRSAGLIDRDERMRDGDRQGGRKAASKIRAHRLRTSDYIDPVPRRLSSRLSTNQHAGPSDPLSIRGAARPTAAGRLRRNAASTSTSTGGGSLSRSDATRIKAVDVWKEFVQSRWNPEARFLNLERMEDDEILKKNSIPAPTTIGSSAREAAVIFKIAATLRPEVQTISLANNHIASGQILGSIHRYLPNLANLSLQNNDLKTWRDIDFISGRRHKLENIRELILTGNELQVVEYREGRVEHYKGELARRFPALEMLDQEPVTRISFDVPNASGSAPDGPEPTIFPCEVGPSFVTGVDGSIISNFLMRFFPTFDTNRAALIDVYDPAATFSYSANTAIPERARIEGHHSSRAMPNQRKLDWSSWMAGGSRNLDKIDLSKTVKSLHIGGEDIIKTVLALPATQHDIGGPPEKFCVDAFPVAHGAGMGLLLTIHGQFIESPSGGIRSFDRTFFLAPAPDGSRAKLNGWDVAILSDQWVVRCYSHHDAWKPGPLVFKAGSKTSRSTPTPVPTPSLTLPPAQQQALLAIPELQRSSVVQICGQTGLNVKYALDCLTGNGWDLGRAVANFNQVKATLPRDAFL